MARRFVFFLRHADYGGFVYLELLRWASGVNGRPAERPPEPRGAPHGTLRGGKMAELRVRARILRIPGSAFSFSVFAAQLRWFRVYGFRSSSPNSRERFPAIEEFRTWPLGFLDSNAIWYPITAAKHPFFAECRRDTLTPK